MIKETPVRIQLWSFIVDYYCYKLHATQADCGSFLHPIALHRHMQLTNNLRYMSVAESDRQSPLSKTLSLQKKPEREETTRLFYIPTGYSCSQFERKIAKIHIIIYNVMFKMVNKVEGIF